MTVDLLVNPFCMAHRDVDSIGMICEKHGVPMNIYNLWDIDDEHLSELPECVATLIREWRTGLRPGSVYSSVFVDGKRIPLNAWPQHLRAVEEKIVCASKEGGNDSPHLTR